jgi:hypothetical protein
MNNVTKIFVDDGLTIPVVTDDPIIKPLIEDWLHTLQERTVAVELAAKTVQAANAAVTRAIKIVSETGLSQDDPLAAVIQAELAAVRTQSVEACNAALVKMRAVVEALARIEVAARNQNPKFN